MTQPSERSGAVVAPEAAAASPRGADRSGGWVVVADGRGSAQRGDRPLHLRRVLAQVLAAALAVLVAVAVVGAVASRRVAERQSVNDAAQMTDLLADSVVQPALEDGVLTGSAASLARLDAVVRSAVLGPRVVRVKVWTPTGRIVYSDEPRVVGQTFALGEEERSVLSRPTTHAEVSDLSRPENRYEQGNRTLLEVYRPVWTPSGQPLLFETYLPYTEVTRRTAELWRGFAGITVSSLLLLITLMLPILWRLLDRVRAAQEHRLGLLQHAVDASADERRRIASSLHDGVVQELAAASYVVAGAAERARAEGCPGLGADLDGAAGTVRGSIGGLRSLLVDIYPPSLSRAGLAAALEDLVGSVRTRDIDVRLVLPPEGRTGLDEEQERLVYRVAQESLRNAARHAASRRVDVALAGEGDRVTLTVSDDGVGFDVAATLASPPEGHLGLRVMTDLAAASEACLEVSSAPGAGTAWRLTLPVLRRGR